ncbi:hypothetical protein ACFL35_02820 [Candidatus Riflebacteria bacterium]
MDKGGTLLFYKSSLFCPCNRLEIFLESIVEFKIYAIPAETENCYRLKVIYDDFGYLKETTLIDRAPFKPLKMLEKKLTSIKQPFYISETLGKKILKGDSVARTLKSIQQFA